MSPCPDLYPNPSGWWLKMWTYRLVFYWINLKILRRIFLKLQDFRQNTFSTKCRASTRKVIMNLWKLMHLNLYRQNISMVTRSGTRNVQENLNLITSFIEESVEKHIPSKTNRSVSSVPWLTLEIRRKISRPEDQWSCKRSPETWDKLVWLEWQYTCI